MNAAQIENNLLDLVESLNNETFIYDFLLAYDTPKSNVKRLKDGALNLSKIEGEILWKKKLLFKEALNSDTHLTIDALKTDPRVITHTPRFIIVTDFKTFLAIDTKNQDSLDISILNLAKNFDFFLPLAGMEKAQYKGENPADVKAAEKMAKLYDEIKKDNPTTTVEEVHGLNVFLSRLLFCFFAEDTEIFSKNQFTNAIKSHTQADGSDLKSYLERLFVVLNTDYPMRENLPQYLNAFPYVNGGLFSEQYAIPVFTRKSLNAILECGDLSWKDINPDIFGSMIQAVITPEHRGGMGMHYTSVPNIMKVIEPLFLDDLKEEFEASKNQPRKLEKLLYRLSKLKIFDPACGSGNFLIIAYKELRFLEIEIIKHLEHLQHAATGFEEKQLALIPKAQHNLAAMYQKQLFSQIQLTQFYGIELDDFAHEIAILSLWLAQHQMNMKFKEVLGQGNPTLPLKEGGHIFQGNATRLDWEKVCPKKDGDEIYILGNPPYLGFNERDINQKTDMDIALQHVSNIQRLDYIGCWFVKATDYIENCNVRYSFVSTNSICQGEQVSLLWPYVFLKNQEIFFAHKSFKWANNAKAKAAVICVIVGIQNKTNNMKRLYSDNRIKIVKSISPYLVEGGQTVMSQRTSSMSNFKTMGLGSSGIDGGHLMLSKEDRDIFIKSDPVITKFIKPFVGGQDFLDKNERYCIWIEDDDVQEAYKSDLIKARIEKCQIYRFSAGRDAKKAAGVPHRFFYRKYKEQDALILPMTSSERRKYIPVGFFNPGTVFSNGVFVIYEPPIYLFSILSSSMHMAWIKITSGRLKSDIRYSVNLTYNTFPFPDINESQKKELEKHAFNILEEREQFSEKTLAQLYDADKMPQSLKEAHHQLDLAVERCYRSKPFESDEERLEHLFKLYVNIVTEEKHVVTLLQEKSRLKI
ncbi:class I SAM-dependent DNA methyltransferase [Pedobacter immunditicola]|uniref:class I SAM-dependent DNA methyltransferase n=1 Tax=Pedobacter immunditicola TaxID=3133440 RepID=UPI0030A7315F